MTWDTTANFLGIKLCSPLVVGACPLTLSPETARELVDSGVGALVLPSVFEEQIEYERFCGGMSMPVSPEHYPVSLTFDEAMNAYNGGLSSYLNAIELVRSAANVPVVANMNGVSGGETTIRSIVPKLSLATAGGATCGEDVVRLMQSGADVVMITSAVYRDGPHVVQRILDEIRTGANVGGCDHLQEIVGQVHRPRHTFPEAQQRVAATRGIMDPNQAEDAQS